MNIYDNKNKIKVLKKIFLKNGNISPKNSGLYMRGKFMFLRRSYEK